MAMAGTNPTDALTSDFPPPEPREDSRHFKSPTLGYFVRTASETNIGRKTRHCNPFSLIFLVPYNFHHIAPIKNQNTANHGWPWNNHDRNQQVSQSVTADRPQTWTSTAQSQDSHSPAGSQLPSNSLLSRGTPRSQGQGDAATPLGEPSSELSHCSKSAVSPLSFQQGCQYHLDRRLRGK